VTYLDVTCRALLGAVFVGALIGKVAGRGAFAAFTASLRRMDVLPAKVVVPAAGATVAAEALVALLVLIPTRGTGAAGCALAAVVLAVFTAAVVRSLRRGNRAPCRCFGASSQPLGPRHVVRNVGLVAVALLGLAATLTAGRVEVAPAVVAGTVGLVLGVLVAVFDDILALVRPAR
jgi:hypothetical protein